MNPKLSSHAYLFGNFNFNATPLAPPGIKIAIHKRSSQRSYHATEGFYVGPSMHHYRCMRCYLPQTRTEIDCDTLEFIPTSVPIPKTTTESYLNQADAHDEAIRVFNEAIGMEQALKQQIQSAINPNYLKGITDRTTQRLIPSIPEIMTWLYDQYGHVTPTMFLAEQNRIMNLSYTPSNPISELWDELEDLQDLSTRANHNLPDALLISLAWSLLNKCGIYAKDLNEWDRLPNEDRTWQNMKTFFNRKHKEYKAVNHGTTLSESSLNHTTEVLSRRFNDIEKPYCSKTKRITTRNTLMQSSTE